jgi:hypothetical protein
MLRRVRAVLITALVWALLWIPVGALAGFIQYQRGDVFVIIPPQPEFLWETISSVALEWALFGALNGGFFAVLLVLAERGRTVATLSSARVALWGAVGTLVLPTLVLLLLVIVFGTSGLSVKVVPMLALLLFGAISGWAMLLIARRRSRHPENSVSGSLTSA